MVQEKELLEQVMDNVVSKVVDGMKENIAKAVEKELQSGLSRALIESEFYRRITDEMRLGCKTFTNRSRTPQNRPTPFRGAPTWPMRL